MTTTKELIEHLQNYYQPNDELAVAIWQVDDVISRAKDRTISIKHEDAKNIVSALNKDHDASVGINWDTIDIYLDDFE